MVQRFIKLIKEIKYLFQKVTRGFSDKDLYNLDYTISKFILPRLIAFKNMESGWVPGKLKSEEEWLAILDAIANSFYLHIKSIEKDTLTAKEQEILNKGFKLFDQWFSYLWW